MSTAQLKAVTKTQDVDTGIEGGTRKDIAKALSKALADSYTLYLKTLGVHWNVVGASFYSLHKLTEEQYIDIDNSVDDLAERIRALGHVAPASYGEFEKLSDIQSTPTPDNAEAMIDQLIVDNETVSRRFREFVAVAEKGDDVFTADMLTTRIGKHEENVWMLRSMKA